MKRFLLIIFAAGVISPVFAACGIDLHKPCSASILNESGTTVMDRIVPSPLEDMKKTDSFQPRYVESYNELYMSPPQSSDYNSNCQFGVCLPEKNNGG